MTIETILNSDMSVAYITDCATSPVTLEDKVVLSCVEAQQKKINFVVEASHLVLI